MLGAGGEQEALEQAVVVGEATGEWRQGGGGEGGLPPGYAPDDDLTALAEPSEVREGSLEDFSPAIGWVAVPLERPFLVWDRKSLMWRGQVDRKI